MVMDSDPSALRMLDSNDSFVPLFRLHVASRSYPSEILALEEGLASDENLV